jgi:hypothetical protein
MSHIVYLLGAGANQSIKDWDGLSPPMIRNFFQTALKKEEYRNEHYVERVRIVYDYIEKYWKKKISDLASSPFDLEECFTLLELQIDRARQKNIEEYRKLWRVQFLLKSFLAGVLSEFEDFASTSYPMAVFGEVLFEQHPTILSFNYDCFTEAAIESASRVNPSIPTEVLRPPPDEWPFKKIEVKDEELAYSHFNWNRPLGYGVTFDEVQLRRAGLPAYVEGDRFYSHPENKLYSWPILKLHGSLNWFRYLPIRKYPTLTNEQISPKLGEKASEIILVDASHKWWFAEPPDLDGWIIDPIIVTPTLYKEKYLHWPILENVWKMAREALSRCDKLVIIGYSFSHTDFTTKQLFLEALCEHDIEDLVIVNPNVSIAEVAKDLCHYEKPIATYENLEEYLAKDPTIPKNVRDHHKLLFQKKCHTGAQTARKRSEFLV